MTDTKPPTAPAFTFAGVPLDRPRIMGILNVTPDSFSDGGDLPTARAAVDRGLAMVEDGADFLDVGGESTRPGSQPVAVDEELRRVVPVVEGLAAAGAVVSVDTRNAPVMRAAVAAGARIVNDVSALTHDPAALEAMAALDAHLVLMHMKGDPRTMQQAPVYADVVADVKAYLAGRVAACVGAGIPRDRVAVDPGIGFGKTVDHNLTLLRHLDALGGLGCPVLLGVSRKSFIARVDRDGPAKGRLAGSLVAALAGVRRGALILRVHDVAETRQALSIHAAIEG
ncbi:MAG: dihydropteroate synthase [Rhodobacterales bacterium]|nr:dihydropteroate synthase [Rhodobacterales bacterium]